MNMKKILVFLFFIINLTGFARFIEACTITSVTPVIPFMTCKSKQSGKEFGFFISVKEAHALKRGSTYKIWFEEEVGYDTADFYLTKYKFLY